MWLLGRFCRENGVQNGEEQINQSNIPDPRSSTCLASMCNAAFLLGSSPGLQKLCLSANGTNGKGAAVTWRGVKLSWAGQLLRGKSEIKIIVIWRLLK